MGLHSWLHLTSEAPFFDPSIAAIFNSESLGVSLAIFREVSKVKEAVTQLVRRILSCVMVAIMASRTRSRARSRERRQIGHLKRPPGLSPAQSLISRLKQLLEQVEAAVRAG
jgi:hypothetical protein